MAEETVYFDRIDVDGVFTILAVDNNGHWSVDTDVHFVEADSFNQVIGNINTALDELIAIQEQIIALQHIFTGDDIAVASNELHDYAQNLINGGDSE